MANIEQYEKVEYDSWSARLQATEGIIIFLDAR